MSVLRSRIIHQGHAGARVLPYGTGSTPMVMPVAVITYQPGEVALYGQLHPIYTPDGAVIAGESHGQVTRPDPGPVVPAGRP